MGPLCHGAWVTAPCGDGVSVTLRACRPRAEWLCRLAPRARRPSSGARHRAPPAAPVGRDKAKQEDDRLAGRRAAARPRTNSRIALTPSGQCHVALSGVRTMRIASTTSWNRKQPRPGPRSASRSSPLYWTGPVERGGRGGVGSAVGSGCVTTANDTGGGVRRWAAGRSPGPRRPRHAAGQAGSTAPPAPSTTATRHPRRCAPAASLGRRPRSAARRAGRTR